MDWGLPMVVPEKKCFDPSPQKIPLSASLNHVSDQVGSQDGYRVSYFGPDASCSFESGRCEVSTSVVYLEPCVNYRDGRLA